MKSKHPEGLDPAFPVPTVAGLPNNNVIYGFNGITIRDYFAGLALQAVAQQLGVSLTVKTVVTKPLIAEVCYELADAMIKERAKHEI